MIKIRKIGLLNALAVYSMLGLFFTFYSLCWSRIIIKNTLGIIRGLAFGFNDPLFGGFILILITFFLWLYSRYRRLLDSVLLVAGFAGICLFILLLSRYYFKSNIEPNVPSPYSVLKILDNRLEGEDKITIPNLKTDTDIRAIHYTSDGYLIGVGGNWLMSNPEEVIFSYRMHPDPFLYRGRGWEIKCLAVDETRKNFYFADFSLKTLNRWEYSDLKPIVSVPTDGVIQYIVLSKDKRYLYAVYDDRLFIDQFEAEDLNILRRHDIKGSNICDFGSLGMSIENVLEGRYLIALFSNCENGILKIDAATMETILTSSPLHNMMWDVKSAINGRSFFIAYPALDIIVEMDAEEMKVKRKIEVKKGIRGLLVDAKGDYLYASNYFTGEIYKINIGSGNIEATFIFPRKSYALSLDPFTDSLFVAGPSGVWVVVKR